MKINRWLNTAVLKAKRWFIVSITVSLLELLSSRNKTTVNLKACLTQWLVRKNISLKMTKNNVWLKLSIHLVNLNVFKKSNTAVFK